MLSCFHAFITVGYGGCITLHRRVSAVAVAVAVE